MTVELVRSVGFLTYFKVRVNRISLQTGMKCERNRRVKLIVKDFGLSNWSFIT